MTQKGDCFILVVLAVVYHEESYSTSRFICSRPPRPGENGIDWWDNQVHSCIEDAQERAISYGNSGRLTESVPLVGFR